jgi:hypothetical protein
MFLLAPEFPLHGVPQLVIEPVYCHVFCVHLNHLRHHRIRALRTSNQQPSLRYNAGQKSEMAPQIKATQDYQNTDTYAFGAAHSGVRKRALTADLG